MARLSGRWGCLLAFSFVPGFLAAYFLHSRSVAIRYARSSSNSDVRSCPLPIKREITPNNGRTISRSTY